MSLRQDDGFGGRVARVFAGIGNHVSCFFANVLGDELEEERKGGKGAADEECGNLGNGAYGDDRKPVGKVLAVKAFDRVVES